MTLVGLARRCAISFLLCLLVGGCFPDSESQQDERKEPNFISGMNLISAMDYQGAIEAFEKALEVNPRNASAHFELGWLYEEKASEPDPAAAIYHYDRYLKFSPQPDKADVVNQIINRCKLELARSVSAAGPLPSPAQQEMDRVLAENKDLQNRLAALEAQLGQSRAVAARPPANRIPGPNSADAARLDGARAISPTPGAASGNHPASANAARTHSVKPGETLAAIARKYGVSLASLSAANPQVKPTRLMVGQILNIPGP
jgi:tetratricopeptide (TPR) repeat protein